MKAIRHMYQLLKPYWLQVSLSLLFLLTITGLQLVIPAIIQTVIDQGLMLNDASILIPAGLAVIGIGIARAILLFWQRFLSVWVADRIAFDLRNRMYDHIQRLSFSYHDFSQTGQLISRCIEDVNATNRFMGMGVIELIRVVLLIFGIAVLLFQANPFLALVALVPMLPLLLLTTSFGRRISKLFYAIDEAMGELSSRLQENVSGAQLVRAFAREPYEIERFNKANRDLYNTRVRTFSEFARLFPTTHLLVTFGTIGILWFGGQMVLRGELSVGELVAFNAYLLLMAQPAQQLAWTINMAGEATAGIRRIFEILEHEPAIATPPKAVKADDLSGKVTFEGVSFSYQGDDRKALEDINLSVEPNQLVALIGRTGSGKTSLINLIPRFYDVLDGAVKIDGYDVRELHLTALRRQIGIVLQTSLLFSDSVAENIALGRPDATDEDIVAAAKAAQAHDFILDLQAGYNTVVGERGITLSGGQRQRVAIARALIMNPRILILDDSTSSVDIETEHQIQQALDTLMAGRTTFVIAHRLSTVRSADLILVMDEGRIVERGRHDELLKNQGLYREIYDLQLKDQESYTVDLAAAAPH
jgi:ATP-binding cassette subfamily B protein